MKILNAIAAMRAWSLDAKRAGARIAFVPTMGALHAGHISLMHTARSNADRLVVSIFVNPLQFGPQEDFERYPRDLERDRSLCEAAGVDVLFHPQVEEMYGGRPSVYVEGNELSQGLCGAFRPGHFRGVLTVVTKLLNIVCPDVAVFGQKDAQQARLIQQLVGDLNFPVSVLVAPTLREADGLAMSSRNMYLNPDERMRASGISKALRAGVVLASTGERNAEKIKEAMRSVLDKAKPDQVEYVEIVAWETLLPVEQIDRKCLAAIAARFGNTRLIDNAFLPESS